MLLMCRDEQAWDRLSVTERQQIYGESMKLAQELTSRGQDDASMVLRVSYAGRSALLVGDIHKRVEKMLVEEAQRRGQPLKADLLKVPHHGSNSSKSGR